MNFTGFEKPPEARLRMLKTLSIIGCAREYQTF